MLGELIFALYGCPGSIFVESENEIKVSKCIEALHVSEVAILEKLCLLGRDFMFFQKFIRENDGFRSHPKGQVVGMYLRAFCSGLEKVLDAYRKDLTTLEQDILKDPHISLFHLQAALDKYFLLFPALTDLINDIRDKEYHGCKLLSLLYTQSGIPIVSEAFNKIFQTCHKPLIKQLTGWMIYGQLFDPYEEFFIRKIKPRELSDFERVTAEKSRGNYPGDYEIILDLLPSFLTIEVAEKILFVGSSVCLFGTNQQELSLTTSMFIEKEDYFSKAIHSLQEGEFSVVQFKTTVDEIRVCAAEHLWKIVVEEGNLLSHLYYLKDFYLLGRGELFLTFIDYAGHLLDIPPTDTTEWKVNEAFRAAVSAVVPDEENIAEKFSLFIRLGNENAQAFKKESLLSGWSSVGLAYNVKRPLHTIFNSKILEKYNKIFRFLLLVRQVQKDLHDCWMVKMKAKKTLYGENQLWQLLTNATFLIDNLQYYLQNDVLESQFTTLVDLVKSKKDFEAILHAHETFLASIITKSFLTWIQVYHVLVDIMNLCRQICKIINSNVLNITLDEEACDIGKLGFEMRRLTTVLLKSVWAAHKQEPHSDLGQLLLKLDFNKYYSATGHLGTNI